MSNQITELQKTETKESFLEKTAKDALSKTIAILLSGGIITVISILIAFVYGLPYYLYLPLGALAFCLTALGFYVFSFRPTNKRLKAEIESLKEAKEEIPLLENTDADKQAEFQKELDNQKEAYQSQLSMELQEFRITKQKEINGLENEVSRQKLANESLTEKHQKKLTGLQTIHGGELRQRDVLLVVN